MLEAVRRVGEAPLPPASSGFLRALFFVSRSRILLVSFCPFFVALPQTGEQLQVVEAHSKQVADMQVSKDGTHFISASADKVSKLWDSETLEHLKTYASDRPINAAAISPLYDHVILGGGQDASQVTTTGSKSGKFETKFYHKIFEEEFGNVRGHFGPINALAFAPDGRSFTSGGEEGYVRINHMDGENRILKPPLESALAIGPDPFSAIPFPFSLFFCTAAPVCSRLLHLKIHPGGEARLMRATEDRAYVVRDVALCGCFLPRVRMQLQCAAAAAREQLLHTSRSRD